MRHQRHPMILRLLNDGSVDSQETLRVLLAREGFEVNQATLSRDLRALGIVKVPTAGGSSAYRCPEPSQDQSVAVGNLRAFLTEIIPSGNLLVVKTRVGCAQPVGLALDQLKIPGIIGTVAGDDTVLVIVEDKGCGRDVMNAIWTSMEEVRNQP
jgi:transcriptional regulator of arginine metabolism